MKLDEKLVHLRKEKGLTQLELAEAVNVSRQAVSKWESGGGMPSTENLCSLSELYGVSVVYLLNEDDVSLNIGRTKKGKSKEQRKKFTLIVGTIIVVIVLTMAGFGFGRRLLVNSSCKEFDELGSENWKNTEIDGFELGW